MYLVDTNVISEARRGSKIALAWIRSVPQPAVYLSVLTIGELQKGVAVLERRDKAEAVEMAQWVKSVQLKYQGQFLSINEEIASVWGRLSAIRTRGIVDGQIAATAIVHSLVMVTRNIKDFHDLPLKVLNPWADP